MRSKLFGNRLRQLRQSRGIGIMDLAPQLDLTYTHLSNLELGYKKPSEDLIHRVVILFNLSQEDEEELRILAGYIPNDISDALLKYPKDAPAFYRRFKPKEKKE